MYASIQNKSILQFGYVIKIKNYEAIKAFGQRVRNLRNSQKLSQEQLANLADIPLSQVGRIERGEVNVTISSIHAIASALGKSLNEFFNY